jgi:hypothetical protein
VPAVARALGLAADLFDVRDVTALDAISAQVARANVQALFISQGPTFNTRRADITAMATARACRRCTAFGNSRMPAA